MKQGFIYWREFHGFYPMEFGNEEVQATFDSEGSQDGDSDEDNEDDFEDLQGVVTPELLNYHAIHKDEGVWRIYLTI